ncbi:DASH family cryptochrome [Zeaxanthinibacter sp. PT1]|uniref:DASH family cryptochrome n=1 Tax=Zeaxanthinibacter TaxID=561554 RepID=UPI00234973D9|nr:DASH family cryptochrome [Zeaxanthinibacter sp. PT1]MDC6351785.1 DASH family cryptochrome [Zeaxanthinibacter sp. PT1]
MPNNLVWFRNDLRTTDNISLSKACEGDRVIAVYCFDPRQWALGQFGFPKTGPFRSQFLWQTVKELQQQLAHLNISLLVFHKPAEHVIPDLIRAFDVKKVFSQKEWTAEEENIYQRAVEWSRDDVEWIEYYDQFLYHPGDIPYKTFKDIPDVFTPFRKDCEKTTEVRKEIPLPQPMPATNLVHTLLPFPSLRQLGVTPFEHDRRSAFPFHGGETKALERLNAYFWKSGNLSQYKETRNGLIGSEYSSKLSAWLANGSVSPRTIYWEVKAYEADRGANQSTYWLIFELIWRDFFKYISLKHGNRIFSLEGIHHRQMDWGNNKEKLQAWINGNTGNDFIDANMTELALTGFMSNRGRQNVASFWAKEWQQDWRIGAAYFESMLIDYDVHSNWGNWMYNSGVGNDPRDRKFNIARQAEQYDRDESYRNLWLKQDFLEENQQYTKS